MKPGTEPLDELDRDAVEVRCPDEPPELSAGAARALLRLLIAVAESDPQSGPGRDSAA
jgi:hypothetical protein